MHNKYPEGISKITIFFSVSLKSNDLHNLSLLKRFYKTNPNYILEFSFDDNNTKFYSRSKCISLFCLAFPWQDHCFEERNKMDDF